MSGEVGEIPIRQRGVHLYFEGDLLYRAMIASIRDAVRRVWLESYIFADDEIGRLFAAALTEAAARGVDVRLHPDAAGSLLHASPAFLKRLRRQGVQVRRFHRWSWRDPFRYNRRNHCKLLIIDNSHAYLGGFNIHRECAESVVGSVRWRDTHVAVTQPFLVEQAASLFERFWSRRWRNPERYAPSKRLQMISNRGPGRGRALRRRYRDLLDNARQSIRLTTPYFIPDAQTMACLRRAAERGVAVQLLLPGVLDYPALRIVARRQYRKLLLAGVRIHEYAGRVLHAKTLSADGHNAIIGTANFDYRSFFHNYELALLIQDPVVAEPLDAKFEQDLGNAVEITSGGLPAPSWRERILGRIGWAFRRWL